MAIELIARKTEPRFPLLGGSGAYRRRAAITPPEDAADARQELPQMEGLSDVVVGANFEPRYPVNEVILAAKHDNAGLTALAKLGGQGQAVLAWQSNIKNDQIRRLVLQRLVHGIAVGRQADPKPFFRQVIVDDLPNFGIVVDDENML